MFSGVPSFILFKSFFLLKVLLRGHHAEILMFRGEPSTHLIQIIGLVQGTTTTATAPDGVLFNVSRTGGPFFSERRDFLRGAAGSCVDLFLPIVDMAPTHLAPKQ